jgi:hypothetical protein
MIIIIIMFEIVGPIRYWMPTFLQDQFCNSKLLPQIDILTILRW